MKATVKKYLAHVICNTGRSALKYLANPSIIGSITHANRLKVFSVNKAIVSSIGRVIFGPIIGYLLILYFGLEGFAAGVLLIQCSMPSAVLNYLVASIYSPKKIVDSVASTIVVSTLMSFITIPIVVFFALKYFN